MEHRSLEETRDTLAQRLAELRDSISATADSRAPVELDQASVGRLSRMDALQGQAMAMASARRRDDEIRRIEAALSRIDTDEYGYCLRCGDEIAAERLAADLAAALCIGCVSETGKR
ncbi:TraR/DksA C4-type zinc finger protein [Emcibacter sp. SYSU 3D8]|uniref:TraR/DksA family transcriptional regulator n=1 Tax=Emcibacter sp. SYSU 3D8 TaxID=3133969 RepID=UPI0031FEE88C